MNILQLEQERLKLKEKLNTGFLNQAKLLFIYNFFEKLLFTENKNLIDSYLPEFLPDHIHCLKLWTVFGMKPRMHELLIEQAEGIEKSKFISENGFESIEPTIEKTINDLTELKKLLNGERIENQSQTKAYFPLLEEETIKETGITIGTLESVTVKINHTKITDKFIIVPSEKEIEEKISDQVKLSWMNAIKIAKKYIRKIHPFHEVIISFDNKAGFCKGNSLGTALTIAFIEEILKTYNSLVAIKVGEGIAFTGGMNEQGKITNTSEEIIKQKTELVFYSDVNLFIVPKDDEKAANEMLNELKEEFPNRDLRVIGIEDINDLLNRRNILEIKKQPVAVRTGKFVKKNWVGAAIVILLTILFTYLFAMDFDDNPYSFTADTDKIYIKNKSGRILWLRNEGVPKRFIDEPNYLKGVIKIVDINDDGENEVIYTQSTNKAEKGNDFSPIICYSSIGKVVWKYSFEDTVRSKREKLSSVYGTFIIDTQTFGGTKCLFAFANSSPSFSSAIFRLDLKTGKRLPGTIWCSGHTVNGIIRDLNNDGKKDILCVGIDNGYEDAVFFGFEIDTVTVARPTTNNYLINGLPTGELLTYIRFPKTDYDDFKNYRTPGINPDSFNDYLSLRYFQFIVDSHMDDFASTLWYQVDYNLKDINVIIDNRFRIMRDSLVVHRKLQLPYTDTQEYVELIKSKILYYKNGKWVKREEME